MSAPDRIWAEPDGGDIIVHNGADDLDALIATGYLHEYLRATPAREHAEELAEALRVAESALATSYQVVDYPADGNSPQDHALDAVRSVLAKLEKEEGK